MQSIPREALETVQLAHVYESKLNGPIYATMSNGCKANPIIWMPNVIAPAVPATPATVEVPKTTPSTPIVEIAECECNIHWDNATDL